MFCLQLLTCADDDLKKFTDGNSTCDITDILMASGFPHGMVSLSNRQLAYECCLTYEVITKRIPSLDDMRKGLSSMTGKQNLLELAAEHPEIRRVVFPEATTRIDLGDLKKIIQYALVDDDSAVNAKLFFEKYLDELSHRGRHNFSSGN